MYDTHTHLGKSAFEEEHGHGPGKADPEELAEFVEKYGIDEALIYPIAFSSYFDPKTADQEVMNESGKYDVPYQKENREVLSWAEEYEEFHPVLAFSLGEQSNVDDIDQLLQEKRDVKALKIHPRASHSDLDLLSDSKILDLARDYEIPIISHLEGDNFPRYVEEFDLRSYSDPNKFLELAERNQDIDFQGAHLGDVSETFLNRVSEMDNVYTDCSPPVTIFGTEDELASDAMDLARMEPLDALEELVSKFPDSIVYGSDYPYMRTRNVDLDEEGELILRLNSDTRKNLRRNAEALYSFEG